MFEDFLSNSKDFIGFLAWSSSAIPDVICKLVIPPKQTIIKKITIFPMVFSHWIDIGGKFALIPDFPMDLARGSHLDLKQNMMEQDIVKVFKAFAHFFGAVVNEILRDSNMTDNESNRGHLGNGSWFDWWDLLGNVGSYSEWKQHARGISILGTSGSATNQSFLEKSLKNI